MVDQSLDTCDIQLIFNTSHNALVFYKILKDITPTIDDCIIRLVNYLNTSIKIQSTLNSELYKKGASFMKLKEYCSDSLDDLIKIYRTLEEFPSRIDETISLFNKMPSRFIPVTIFDKVYDIINYIELYNSWIKIINTDSLYLSELCETVRCYICEITGILDINKKTFNRAYKELNFHDTKYQLEVISNLQKYCKYLHDTLDTCKIFAIISAIRYKDLKNNNTYCHNIKNYIKITSELTKIKNKLNNDITYTTLKENILKLNNTLSFCRDEYILAFNRYNCNDEIVCFYAKRNIMRYIDDIFEDMNISSKELLLLTHKYDKKNKQYTKVTIDYEKFIRIMFYGII